MTATSGIAGVEFVHTYPLRSIASGDVAFHQCHVYLFRALRLPLYVGASAGGDAAARARVHVNGWSGASPHLHSLITANAPASDAWFVDLFVCDNRADVWNVEREMILSFRPTCNLRPRFARRRLPRQLIRPDNWDDLGWE